MQRQSLRYRNLLLLLLGLFIAFLVGTLEPSQSYLTGLGTLGYLGALAGGLLFVLSFTVAVGSVILFAVSESLPVWQIALVGGAGALIGDYTIFKFVKDDIREEFAPIYERFGGRHITALLHTSYFSWTLPIIGALIIASPLPDEIGVTLIGISKMKPYQFVILSFILNTLGIFFLLSAVSFFLK